MIEPSRKTGGQEAPFSVSYSPENGYCASKGESLDMRLEIIPYNGFSEPVNVKLRIKVPDPALGLFTIYDQVHDLGTHIHPYCPLCYTQDLNPENPPAGYGFIKKAYSAAKKMKIDSIDVHVYVKASGGGFVCENKSLYKVSF